MRKLWKWFLIVPFIFVLGFGGFVISATAANAPMPAAEAALQSTAAVNFTEDEWYLFQPTDADPTVGFILYPGGLVPASAYAPTARAIAAEGFLVVLVPMPLNLAVLNNDAAADVIARFPDIERWALGGHSLGGAMAAAYASNNPDAVDGLVLWAAYPAEGNDLSGQDTAVLSLYGTKDGISSLDEIEASAERLPPDAQFVRIIGGNHTQFGWYGSGPQAGDNPAPTSRQEQQDEIVQHTAAFLQQLAAAE